jgi:hypothetical protein
MSHLQLRTCVVATMGRLLSASLLVLLPARVAAQVERPKSGVPYDVDKRPQPQGSDLAILLPVHVGAFTREPLPADTKPPSNEDLNVHYVAGGDSIFVGFSLPDNAADAQAAVTTTRDEAGTSKEDLKAASYRVGKDPSYFKAGKFMSWTRGRYFYYADANRPSALDRFMRAFPF